MENFKLTTATDSETGWPVLIQETKNSRSTFALDPNTNRYFYLHGIFPREWREVSPEDTPPIETAFRKAYGPETD